MTSEPKSFFAGLTPLLQKAGFDASQGTATGMNIYFARRRKVTVTVNYAQRDDRLSVKMTVHRGAKGGPTRVFDAICAKFKTDEHKLNGDVEWDKGPLMTESKLQVRTKISVADNPAHYQWVMKNATVLRDWAQWSESVAP